jgi:flagellar biosynthesis protein FlhA
MATPTPIAAPSTMLDRFAKQGDIIFAVITVVTVVFLVVPLPAIFLDLFLTISLAISLMIMMTVIYVKSAVQFSGFPSILLFITLFRLALNVATTRSILDDGEAGSLIEAFGAFVMGGNYVVGVVIFAILVTINFVVITKGAGRVAEVAARFTLDALPGKQMSIDADLNAGLITESEAKQRRLKLGEESDFYGAMDGSTKFVRGDAIAGIIIILINVIGGFAVGVFQKGMPLMDALEKYTLLTVGDGLVTQIPALLISTAAGILVTRTPSKENLGQDIATQLLSYHKGLYAVSVIMALLAFIPGFPWWAFMLFAALFFALARLVEQNQATAIASGGGGGAGIGPVKAVLSIKWSNLSRLNLL